MSSVVYFIQAADGRIKIGTSRNLERRIANLRGMVPGGVTLLCSVPGGHALEDHLHTTLCEHCVSGEWFEPAGQVLAVVEQYRTQGANAIPAGFEADVPTPKRTLLDARHIAVSEMKVMIRACAEPALADDSAGWQIDRAARRTGLSRKRTSCYWYGEVRVVPVEEYFHVARVALAHVSDPDTAAKVTHMVGALIGDFAAAATRFAKLYGPLADEPEGGLTTDPSDDRGG